MPGTKKRRPKPPVTLPVIILSGIFQPLYTPLFQHIGQDRNYDGRSENTEQDNNKTNWERLFHLLHI